MSNSISQVTVFQTSDGKIFVDEADASAHEAVISRQQAITDFVSAEGVGQRFASYLTKMLIKYHAFLDGLANEKAGETTAFDSEVETSSTEESTGEEFAEGASDVAAESSGAAEEAAAEEGTQDTASA
jgi:hypothetical protein